MERNFKWNILTMTTKQVDKNREHIKERKKKEKDKIKVMPREQYQAMNNSNGRVRSVMTVTA